ncbi:hypothetical protein CKM354_000765200 [Cercospora kikuchii]|uniref:Peptidase A2 domain-containing protein n=1 Tax=Cercospora kikuchii TaxID=84275 RepID=A0A9P3CRJ4_9PEZI|nr:uncharacterized protein CKM354_000765200 [Cercospora kikuchii]GIZ44455.1 hypothetical protein CKM354_000765200 [Cercospora kikuchii]
MKLANTLGTILAAVALVSSAPTSRQQDGKFAVRQEEDAVYGNLTLDTTAERFTFDYATSDPFSTNWIGLYPAAGGGPVDEEYVSPSTVWKYAPETEGSVYLSTEALQPGDYQVYFLARDGYRWLAEPITVTLSAPPAELKFPVESATLHNARQWSAYTAQVEGLLLGKGDSAVTFEKANGDEWISVGEDGTLSGKPGIFNRDESMVTVRAIADNGSTATLKLRVPVRKAWQPLVQDLRIMAFNLWHGGTRVSNFQEKQLRFILDSGADVVVLQEASGSHGQRLGQALGWSYFQSAGSVAVISRYPIVEKYGEISASGGVRININGNRRLSLSSTEINVWSAHLGYTPYGPYDFCFDNMTKEEVLAREAESGRTPQITAILSGIQSQLRNSRRVPVILAGDFNAPSHLDWVPALAEKNCGVDSFDWPTSILPTARGLVDSFRVANPDPVAVQATTWSPLYPRHNGDTGREEPQDRIDFIYHTREGLRVIESKAIVVENPRPYPQHADNEWTTDHAAVLTHYRL